MTPARVCAEKINLNKNTVDLWYQKIRQAIALIPEAEKFSGEVEIDESYFGKKKPGGIGTGMVDKVAVFGVRERHSGKVWCTATEGTDHTYLLPLIESKVAKGSVIYSDGFGAYTHLNKLGYTHHVVLHSQQEYVRGKVIHTNGIESFWAFAKRLLRSRRGLGKKHYHIHLKEAAFRFNNRDKRLMRLLVRDLLR